VSGGLELLVSEAFSDAQGAARRDCSRYAENADMSARAVYIQSPTSYMLAYIPTTAYAGDVC
jgi:hypothetical protein